MTTSTNVFRTYKHRAFIIELKISDDKEYYYVECKRSDGSLIHDIDQHYLFEDINEAVDAGKEIIDEFLDN